MEKFMFNCELCNRQYQHGPHIYEGKRSKLYDIWVCDICWSGNWDGWAAFHEPVLLTHLQKKGLPVPNRNSKGWFPRE